MDPGAVPGGSTISGLIYLSDRLCWGRNRIDMRNKDRVCVRLRYGRIRSNFTNANDNFAVANDNSFVAAKVAA